MEITTVKAARYAIALFLLVLLASPAATHATARRGDPVAEPSSVGPGALPQGSTKTVVLVRHAEKATESDPEFDPAAASDPPLNAAGRARAEVLARTLAEAGVTSIYASEFARTRQTVAPLAAAIGVDVVTHPARDTRGLTELIVASPGGSTIVVSGHSNTVPAIIEALGAGAVDAIGEAWEYDNLYVVVLEPDGRARVNTLKYGATSTPDSGALAPR
jgi:broad specificity phosphatase PhoE